MDGVLGWQGRKRRVWRGNPRVALHGAATRPGEIDGSHTHSPHKKCQNSEPRGGSDSCPS